MPSVVLHRYRYMQSKNLIDMEVNSFKTRKEELRWDRMEGMKKGREGRRGIRKE